MKISVDNLVNVFIGKRLINLDCECECDIPDLGDGEEPEDYCECDAFQNREANNHIIVKVGLEARDADGDQMIVFRLDNGVEVKTYFSTEIEVETVPNLIENDIRDILPEKTKDSHF